MPTPTIPKPRIPDVHCGACRARLFWCGVRDEWVDSRHRNSHDDDGRRVRHTPTQERTTR